MAKSKDKEIKKNKEGRKIIELEVRQDLKAMEMPKNYQEAKGRIPQTGMLAMRDIIVGGIVGGRMGTGLGRFGLVAGGVTAGLGYYFGQPWMAGIGVGMAAGGMTAAAMENKAPTPPPALDGFDFKTRWEMAMQRMKAFDAGVKKNLFLDKLTKGKAEVNQEQKTETTDANAATETPLVEGLGNSDDPLAELEMQMASEAINFQRENGAVATDASQFAGMDADEDFEDEEEEVQFFRENDFEDEEEEFEEGEQAISAAAHTMEFRPEISDEPAEAEADDFLNEERDMSDLEMSLV